MYVHAQVNESFTDGDFTGGILWSGNNASWLVSLNSDVSTGATGSNTLRLNVAAGSGTAYLSTQVTGSWGLQQTWGCWIGRRAQAATASNVSYVWLYASEANITSATVDGYRIRFGDDASAGDKIFLEAINNGSATTVLSSAGSTPNGITDFGFLIRIIRDAAGSWSLFTSVLPLTSGSGAIATDIPDATNANVLQGSATHNGITGFDNGYLALAAQHTTAAAARTALEFDQITLGITSGSPLPVRFGFIEAFQTTTGVRITWNNTTETDVLNYKVERSTNGNPYLQIGELAPARNDGGLATYQITDHSPGYGNNLYRIKVEELSGKIIYSRLIRFVNFSDHSVFILYPNPVTNGLVGLLASSLSAGNYKITIRNMAAQPLISRLYKHGGGSLNLDFILEHLPKGIYFFEIRGPVQLNKQFVVQ